jgi:dimethylargininase
VAPVAAALAEMVTVETMEAPATLDGGDVLMMDSAVFVGISSRTNQAGAAALRDFLGSERRVIAVPVSGALHLKSAVTALDGATVIMEPGVVDPGVFSPVRVIETSGEPHGANVVRLPDGTILAAEAHAGTAASIRAAGFGVVTVDVGEFERADGGLTCLSIRLRDR